MTARLVQPRLRRFYGERVESAAFVSILHGVAGAIDGQRWQTTGVPAASRIVSMLHGPAAWTVTRTIEKRGIGEGLTVQVNRFADTPPGDSRCNSGPDRAVTFLLLVRKTA